MLSILMVIYLSQFSSGLIYEYWQPEYSHLNRSYLMCLKSYCTADLKEDIIDRQEQCCFCNSRPSWEVFGKTKNLNIEYIRRNGESIINEDYDSQDAEHLTLIHTGGLMSKMPRNLCDFDKIVTIDLVYNELSEVGNLSCLRKLDTLDLSYNNIHYISNKTFIGLENLRILRIKHSNLKVLEPASVTGDTLEIHLVDFSQNELQELEFSNAISESGFCELDYSENKITEIVNTNNFQIEEDKKYRAGLVDMNNNDFTKFIDFTQLGVVDIAILGKVMDYGFIMTDMKWDCDCQMEPYLELSEPFLAMFWRDYFNITCWNPPELRGESIFEITKNDNLHLLICNLTEEEKCPRDCHCFYQPRERRTVVDCSNANLNSLPTFVPDKANLTLIFKNNSITQFENRPYLQNTTAIDFSFNDIFFIDPDAVNSFPQSVTLDFEGNALSTIPNDFQTFDPCSVNFGQVIVKCDCDTLWQKDWIGKSEQAGCTSQTVFICDGIGLSVAQIVKEDICQTETDNTLTITVSIILAVLASLIAVVASTVYMFRYEIFIWYRSHTRSKKLSKVTSMPLYDVYMSFPEDNDEIRQWILFCLKPELQAGGYKLFIPCIHFTSGSVKEENIISNVSCSRNFLIVLSDDFRKDGTSWAQIEWKHIWHNFSEKSDRQIVVINFGQLETKDEKEPRIRAFLRLGYYIDFSNRKHDIINQIEEKLGIPIKIIRQPNTANRLFFPKYSREFAMAKRSNIKKWLFPKYSLPKNNDERHKKYKPTTNNKTQNPDIELKILDF